MVQLSILMIGHDHLDALFISNYLRDRSIRVTTAMDVKMAYRFMLKDLPDLILLCSKNEEGLIFCRQFRRYSDVPIIILSENHQKMEELRALEAGADDFVFKPFFMEILFSKIKAVIRRNSYTRKPTSLKQTEVAFIQS